MEFGFSEQFLESLALCCLLVSTFFPLRYCSWARFFVVFSQAAAAV